MTPAPGVDVTDWPVDQLDQLGAATYEHVDGVEVVDDPAAEDLNVWDAHGD